MNSLTQVEEHPLPPDTWGEAPQSPLFVAEDAPPSSAAHTTVPPPTQLEG